MAITSLDSEAVSIFILGDQYSKEVTNLGFLRNIKER